MRRLLFISLAIAFLAAGCSSGGCYDNQSAVPLAEFRESGSDKALVLRGVTISGVGAPNDSVLIEATTQVSQFYLPMRASADNVEWCLKYNLEGANSDDFNDTIRFDYTAKPYFASNECGAFYIYNIDRCTYTTHLVDSVAVLDSLITNVDIVRIAIYIDTHKLDPTGEEAAAR